jgi:hypothetical protein
MTLNLPNYDQGLAIVTEHGLTELSRDGWACIQTEHAGFAKLLLQLHGEGKVEADAITGVSLLVGMLMQTSPGQGER